MAKSVTEAATGQAVATTHTIFATESPGKKQSKMAVSIGITKSFNIHTIYTLVL